MSNEKPTCPEGHEDVFRTNDVGTQWRCTKCYEHFYVPMDEYWVPFEKMGNRD